MLVIILHNFKAKNGGFIKLKYAARGIYVAMNVKSLLVLILALSIALPSAVTLPMVTSVSHAQTQASVSIDVPIVSNPTSGGTVYRTLYINNPTSAQGITQISISIPKSLATSPASSNASKDVYFEGLSSGATSSLNGIGPWSYLISKSPSSTILPPGAAAYVEFGWNASTAGLKSSNSVSNTVTVTLTYTSGATQSFDVTIYYTKATEYSISPVSPSTLGASAGNLTAGELGSFTVATVVPTTSGVTPTGGPVPVYLTQTTTHGVISPSSLTTSSSGAAFTVNDTHVGSYIVTAYSGHIVYTSGTTGPFDEGYVIGNASYVLTIEAASPSKVAVKLPWDGTGSTDYVTNASSSVYPYGFKTSWTNISLTDRFGNPYPLGNTTVTLSATAGSLYLLSGMNGTSSGIYYKIVSGNDSSTLKFNVVLLNGVKHVDNITFGFAPPTAYGSFSQITAVINGKYPGTSNKLITSTFEPVSPKPTIYYKGVEKTSSFNATAGKTITAVVKVNPVQAGVPVNFTIVPSTVKVSASPMTGIAYTNKSGYAVFTFTDTVAGDQFNVEDYLFQPLTSNPAHNESLSGPSPTLTIVAGPPAALVVTAPSLTNNYISPLGSTLINVSLADQYGNPTTNTLGAAIQIQLSTSAGSLSASTVYILQSKPDTYSSGYLVYFTAPNATGPVTITATSVMPGISPGKLELYVVTKYPMLGVISPANGAVLTT
ncbi:MAG: hypothetical protein ACP5L5_11620, partial [Vulcanisaeta sp.]|uniref:hypothetical protein n=1 Tax=Vulcanisaeta sp. TaxID=2020871 RepID=UPI003D1427BB